MDLDTKYVMFNRLNEAGGHLFFEHKHVKKIWKETQLEGRKREAQWVYYYTVHAGDGTDDGDQHPLPMVETGNRGTVQGTGE